MVAGEIKQMRYPNPTTPHLVLKGGRGGFNIIQIASKGTGPEQFQRCIGITNIRYLLLS